MYFPDRGCVHTLLTSSVYATGRVSNISRVSNTSRGSEAFVQIEAGGFYYKFYGKHGLKLRGGIMTITVRAALFSSEFFSLLA